MRYAFSSMPSGQGSGRGDSVLRNPSCHAALGQTPADGPMVDTSCVRKTAAKLPARPPPAVVSKVSGGNAQCPLRIPPEGRSEPLAWNPGLRVRAQADGALRLGSRLAHVRRTGEFSGHACITARAAAVAREAVAMPG